MLGSRALRSAGLRIPSKEGRRKGGFERFVFLGVSGAAYLEVFCLLPAAACLFCCSHSPEEELSGGLVSENKFCLLGEVTAETAR